MEDMDRRTLGQGNGYLKQRAAHTSTILEYQTQTRTDLCLTLMRCSQSYKLSSAFHSLLVGRRTEVTSQILAIFP